MTDLRFLLCSGFLLLLTGCSFMGSDGNTSQKSAENGLKGVKKEKLPPKSTKGKSKDKTKPKQKAYAVSAKTTESSVITPAKETGGIFDYDMGPHDPAAEKLLASSARDIDKNQRRLKEIYRNHDPEALPFLIAIAANNYDPLATSAIYLIRRYPQTRAVNFLAERTESDNAAIRKAALNSLLKLDSNTALLKARKMLRDKDAAVRDGAILVVGMLKDTDSKGALLDFLDSKDPFIRLSTAWALLHCGDYHKGAGELKELAQMPDTNVCIMAMKALRDVEDIAATRILYNNIFSSDQKIQIAAVAMLEQKPEPLRQKALSTYPPEKIDVIELRLSVIAYLLGKSKFPERCSELLDSPAYQDKDYGLDCLERGKRIKDIPAIINALADRYSKIRERAAFLLVNIAGIHKLPKQPEDIYDIRAWRRWWLYQYRVIASDGNRAILSTPLAQTTEITTDSRLDFAATVKMITPGNGQNKNIGASVELLADGYPLIIDSKETGN